MTITKLRKQTGAPITICKEAIQATSTYDEALQYVKDKGQDLYKNKAQREATEGVITTGKIIDSTYDYPATITFITELNCETDFTARTQEFIDTAEYISVLWASKTRSNAIFSEIAYPLIADLALSTGENIQPGRADLIFSNSKESSSGLYLHSDKKLGAMVSFMSKVSPPVANDIAMHIASEDPQYVSPETIPPEEVHLQEEAFLEAAQNKNIRPEHLDKFVQGQLNKWYSTHCLTEQSFIKDPKIKIKDLIPNAQIFFFKRIKVGEE